LIYARYDLCKVIGNASLAQNVTTLYWFLVLKDAGDVAFNERCKSKLIEISDKPAGMESGNPFVGLRKNL
jgi:hypothetical protein